MTPTEEIKERLDIIEVLSGYLKVQKAGRNFRALCPFHNEKTPSFMISPERQMWHCFGCNEGGDIFDFVMKIEGLEFVDALRLLAQRAGVALKRQDPKIQSEKSQLFEICELATDFFTKQLQASQAGKKAHDYLKQRGLKEKTILEWRLGFAPDSWDALTSFLKKRGYSEKKIVAAGLAVAKEKGNGCYDRFRSRIMFPLFDGHEQAVGFAGRIFGQKDDKQGKYINTPQTLIYDKSRVLYGLHKAKGEMRKKDRSILVEGNLDVILSQQAGFKETVAASGTALTAQQLKIIKRYTNNLIFAFDSDEAGFAATKKAIKLALENDFSIKILAFKEKDPADIIQSDPAKWEGLVNKAVNFFDFLFKKTAALSDIKTSQGKRKMAGEILPFVKKIANPVERAHWLSRLATLLEIGERYLQEALSKIVQETGANHQKPEAAAKTIKDREGRLQEFLASALLTQKKVKDFKGQFKDFLDEEIKNILELFLEAEEDEKKLFAKLKDEKIRERCQSLFFRGEENETSREEIETCFVELKKINLKKKIAALGNEIKQLEEKKQKEEVKKSLLKLQKLLEELNNLENNAE